MTKNRKQNHNCGATTHSCSRCGHLRLVMLRLTRSLITVLCASGVAVAANGYIGAGLGNAKSSFDREFAEFAGPDVSPDKVAWRLFGGCQVIPFLGLEGGYIQFGKPRVHEEVHEDFFEAELTGFDLAVVGMIPIATSFSVFARGGPVFWNSDMTYRFTDTGSGTGSASGTSLAFGVGAKYSFLKYFGVRAEYTRYTIDEAKSAFGEINLISASVLFEIGL